MTPNVSRLLQKWGVADVVGPNLVRVEELNMRRQDGTKVCHMKMARVEETLGYPWWLVHRAHLHEGLATVAQREGAELIVDARVRDIDYSHSEKVAVTTEKGSQYIFDLCIGSDGVNSIVRNLLFPDIKPEPPTTNSAYRAIVPYSQILEDPLARELVEKATMEVWMGDGAYIITYPISNSRDLNLVLSHHTPTKAYTVQNDVPLEEMRQTYASFDPRIRRILDMIPSIVRLSLLIRPSTFPN